MGKPRHTQLASIGTFRQSEFSARAEEFWTVADEKLDDLVKTNKLWSNDRIKVERAFAKHIPRPVTISPKTTEPTVETDYEVMKNLIADLAARAERKLAERGI